jgi:hypothetical protein
MVVRVQLQLAWQRAVQPLWFRFLAIKAFGVSSVVPVRPGQLITNVREGSMIHKAGAGPEPIPHKQLTVAKLTDAITFAISPSAKAAAREMAGRIRSEVGSIYYPVLT